MSYLEQEFADSIKRAINHHSDVFDKTDWSKQPVETFFVGGLRIELKTLKIIECANIVHLLGGTAEIEVDDARLAQYLKQYYPHFDIKVQDADNFFSFTVDELYRHFHDPYDPYSPIPCANKPPVGDIRKTVVEEAPPGSEELRKTWDRLLYGHWPKD